MAEGSTIIMTENAYMTDEAWLKASEAIVRGYRSLPYVKENEEWLMVELLDGFKSHENVLAAHELRRDNKIRSLKEESNTSHVNQGYDQLTAKSDKKNAAEALYDQRKVQKWKTGRQQLDQYELIQCGMHLVRALQPETWILSFRRVNLEPSTRLPFPDWCKKIRQFLRAGELFKEENVDATPMQKFNLLPSFWHGMKPAERKVVMTIVSTHGGSFSPDCLQQLHTECRIPYSQLSDLRVCVYISTEHPETIDYDKSDLDPSADDNEKDTNTNIKEATMNVTKQNDGLDHFQLIPKTTKGKSKLAGEDLFKHVVTFRNVNNVELADNGDPKKLLPSDSLDVELSRDGIKCIQPNASELRRAAILRDSFGEQAIRKCAKRKLNNIGNIVGQSTVVNSDENIRKIKLGLQLADSMAEVARREAIEKASKEKESHGKHEEKAPGASRKLEKNDRKVASLSIPEIGSILYHVYNITLSGSKLRKPDYVRALEAEMERNIGKYEVFVTSIETTLEVGNVETV